MYPPKEYTLREPVYDAPNDKVDAESESKLAMLARVDPLYEFTNEDIQLLRKFKVLLFVLLSSHYIVYIHTCISTLFFT